MALPDKTIFECPVYTLYTQLDGSQRLVIQPSNDAAQDFGVPLSLLAQWLFSNYQTGLYSGTTNPDNALGSNGDLYLQNGSIVKQKIGGIWVTKWVITGGSGGPVINSVFVTTSTNNPIDINVIDNPGMTDTSVIIYEVVVDGNTFDRQVNFDVKANYVTGTFTGFTIFGNDDPDNPGHFAEDAYFKIAVPGVTVSNITPPPITDSTSVLYDLAGINAAYPTALYQQQILCPNINTIYYKLDNSPTGNWDVQPYNPLT